MYSSLIGHETFYTLGMEGQLPSNDRKITRQFNLDLQRGRKYLSPLSAATLQVVNFALSQVQPSSVE